MYTNNKNLFHNDYHDLYYQEYVKGPLYNIRKNKIPLLYNPFNEYKTPDTFKKKIEPKERIALKDKKGWQSKGLIYGDVQELISKRKKIEFQRKALNKRKLQGLTSYNF